MWRALHAISFAYPDVPSAADAGAAEALFRSLAGTLPCGECRQHYAHELGDGAALRRALSSRDALSRWLVELHNRVNVRMGKSQVPYEVVLRAHEDLAGCTSACDERASAAMAVSAAAAMPPTVAPPLARSPDTALLAAAGAAALVALLLGAWVGASAARRHDATGSVYRRQSGGSTRG